MRKKISTLLFLLLCVPIPGTAQTKCREALTRGLLAVPADEKSAYVSWRIFGDDPDNVAFNLYKSCEGDTVKLNGPPITETSGFTDTAVRFDKDNAWILTDIDNKTLASYRIPANNRQPYISIPLKKPEGGTMDGEDYTYTANDASVGDLDGDGEYEIILKWEPTNAKRPPQKGFAANTHIDAYKMDGTFLWRIDLGKNIRSGAATTQFLVYDFDGDGCAEIICKTADGTTDGTGKTIGDSGKDWRNHDKNSAVYGTIIEGPEYISVFEGKTGKELATAQYIPTRYPLDGWGGIGGNGGNDTTGGRANRFTACVAYLGGDAPSAVMVRGWYGRSVLAAWDYKDGELTSRWVFDSALPQWEGYSGMGNHSVTVADFDGDGYDEICIGAMTVDHDGKGLFTTGLRHGDALHAGDLIPSRPGLEVYGVHENEERTVSLGTPGVALFDGKTGDIVWSRFPGEDVGRGVAADIDPRYPGAECWGGPGGLKRSDTGEEICKEKPDSQNFLIWWDADPLRELLDKTTISKWNRIDKKTDILFSPPGVASNNGTKATPCLTADILGDWREEVIWRTPDSSELRIYSTPIPAAYRTPTLMHDHQYRMAIAWQNVGYNQPPHPSFDMVAQAKNRLTDASAFHPGLFDTYWTAEGQEYEIRFCGDTIELDVAKGLTVWRNEKYHGDVEISYKACVMDEGGPNDRLSDLNCFWMAGDPLHPDDLFRRQEWRAGVFGNYYTLELYYLGYGGNDNTTTRFRKYDGGFDAFRTNKTRPAVLTEYTGKEHLLRPNHWYDIRIVCRGKQIKYYMDNELIVDYTDETPYTSGHFGFRTTKARIRITGYNARQQ